MITLNKPEERFDIILNHFKDFNTRPILANVRTHSFSSEDDADLRTDFIEYTYMSEQDGKLRRITIAMNIRFEKL